MQFEALRREVMTSDRIVVPENAALTGGSREDFLEMGCIMLGELLRTTALAPDSRVLEIGSGLGRIAYPLALYLDGGSYVGLEIVRDSVQFCSRHVAPLAGRATRFEFRHLDCYNEFYNPGTPARLRDMVFPELGEFDLVFMSSVCTHLDDEEMRLYVKQAASWLRPGGEFWATYFLIDDAAAQRLASEPHLASRQFDVSAAGPDYYLDQNRSTAAVAYRQDYVASRLQDAGLAVKTMELGRWSGVARTYFGYQDLVVAVKP
jgi:SAM-dependent methyltransferase